MNEHDQMPSDKIELPGEVNRYQLICFVNEPSFPGCSNFATEHNAFASDGMFSSIEEAWERNEDMGSRWVFYPFRLIVDQNGIIAALDDCMSQELVGYQFEDIKKTIQVLIEHLENQPH